MGVGVGVVRVCVSVCVCITYIIYVLLLAYVWHLAFNFQNNHPLFLPRLIAPCLPLAHLWHAPLLWLVCCHPGRPVSFSCMACGPPRGRGPGSPHAVPLSMPFPLCLTLRLLPLVSAWTSWVGGDETKALRMFSRRRRRGRRPDPSPEECSLPPVMAWRAWHPPWCQGEWIHVIVAWICRLARRIRQVTAEAILCVN